MAQRTYKDESDRICMEKTNNILLELPSFVSDYFLSRKTNTTARTRQSYVYDLRNFFRYLVSVNCDWCSKKTIKEIKIEDLKQINARKIEGYLDYLQTDAEKMNHKAGVARKYASLSSFFDYLYRNDLLPENPCAKVLTVRPEKDTRIIRLSPDETARFLNTIEFGNENITKKQRQYLEKTAVRDLAIATLFLGTGIRVSELVGVNISDISFEKCQLTIFAKGEKYRTVALGDEVIESLEKYIEERQKIVAADRQSENALFLSMQRKRMSVQSVENMITKYAVAAGIENHITPHKLRKTYGTELYNETGDIYLVSKALGHNNVNTTKTHYVAQDEEDLLAARNKVKLR